MNKTPRLSKSGIEYLDYSWGIWSGCRNLEIGNCSVKACWAKGLTARYPQLYPNGFEPTYYPEAIDSPKHLKKPSRISVGWVGDIIGYCDSHSIARENIERTIKDCPQHTFLFLTKNPEKLFQWKFPDNCWVGVTATNEAAFSNAFWGLRNISVSVKYISFEPLLGRISEAGNGIAFLCASLIEAGIKWVIIGSQTKPYKPPEISWVEEIVRACDKAGVPVFLKDNLEKMCWDAGYEKIKDMSFYEQIQHDGDFVAGVDFRQEIPVEIPL